MCPCSSDTRPPVQSAAPGILTPARRQTGMRQAVRSACWGAISQVMVKDSSVIIVFAALIGAGEITGVFTTSMLDLAVCFLMLPFAWISDRLGARRQIVAASFVALVSLLVAAASPWFGAWTTAALLVGLACYAIAISGYLAAWFPLLEYVVPEDGRGLFFGRMRFYWQTIAMLFIMFSGWYVGRFASVARLQVVIAFSAVCLLGRAWYCARMPDPGSARRLPGARAAISDLLDNRFLIGFALYLFFLYASASSTLPVVFVFARNYLHFRDSLVVMLSALSMVGLIAGYAAGGLLVHRYGIKPVLLAAHAGFALLNASLLLIRSGAPAAGQILAVIATLYGLFFACASVAVSSELLALASPRNKAISIAFGYSLYSAGIGLSRAAASLALGSGLLAPTWRLAGRTLTRYHSLFLLSCLGVLAAALLLALVPAVTRRADRLPA